MKKTLNFVFAAIAMLTVASCAKELAPETVKTGVEKTLTFSFDAAKTALDGTKTVWCAGDSIWVSDGTTVDKIYVPEEFDGKSTFTYSSVHFSGVDPLYAVYPCSAAKSVSKEDGVLKFNIPSDQDGHFESANICVAKSTDFKFAMKNATGLLKISVVDDIETVVVSSNAVISGEVTVSDFETLALTPVTTTGTTINLTTAGLAGDYYLAVAPGTYSQFGLLALTTDGKFQKKDATASNTIARSQIATLGEIGSNLTGLEGDGSEGNPYVIPHVGAMTAFAAMVNGGETFEGKFVKVTADFDGVTLPAGYYKSDDDNAAFCGDFDGQGHTIGLAITSNSAATQGGYLGLIGYAFGPAYIHDVTVEGSVINLKGNCNGGVVGCLKSYVEQSAVIDSAKVVNCVNKANLQFAGSHNGGVVGWANYARIINCKNEGTITSTGANTGGVAGYTYQFCLVKDCLNTGSVTNRPYSATRYSLPTGGIVGRSDSETVITYCQNEGTVSCGYMAGGILGSYQSYVVGVTSFNSGFDNNWSGYTTGGSGYTATDADFVTYCKNKGDVIGGLAAGGIVGGQYRGNIKYCENYGNVTAVDKQVGGIVGWTQNCGVQYCKNYGKVEGKYMVAGIMGYKYWSNVKFSDNYGDVTGQIWVGGVCGASNKQNVLYNNRNYGKVKSVYPDSDRYLAVGGIQGGGWQNQDNANAINNCANYGPIEYLTPSADPRVGGIIGTTIKGNINNVFNSGAVTCGGEAVEGATVGSIAGFVNPSNVVIDYSYTDTLATVNLPHFGNAAPATSHAWTVDCANEGNILGSILPVVPAGGSVFDSVTDALDAWVCQPGSTDCGEDGMLWTYGYMRWEWDSDLSLPVFSHVTAKKVVPAN